MQSFEKVTGIAAPLLDSDVNTDQIAPSSPTEGLHPDYAKMLFHNARRRPDGSEDPDFVLNQPQFRTPSILLVGENFGCGSSRESAVWSMMAFGIHCIVARSFADIYRENCLKNGILPIVLPPAQAVDLEASVLQVNGSAPFTADLREQRIVFPDGREVLFEIPPDERTALLEGLDDIGITLQHLDAIESWESKTGQDKPWLQEMVDSEA